MTVALVRGWGGALSARRMWHPGLLLLQVGNTTEAYLLVGGNNLVMWRNKMKKGRCFLDLFCTRQRGQSGLREGHVCSQVRRRSAGSWHQVGPAACAPAPAGCGHIAVLAGAWTVSDRSQDFTVAPALCAYETDGPQKPVPVCCPGA